MRAASGRTAATPHGPEPTGPLRQVVGATPSGVAAALIGLNTVMDAFVVPQRGTRWTDHLAAGLVPLALVTAAAMLWPRSRPGTRAVLAATLGVLALVGAALAAADRAGGPGRASDWTGLVLGPVGAALCGLALLTLWRSRKQRGHRYLRRSLIAAGALVGAYWLLLPVSVALVATHRPRAEVRAVDLGAPYRTVTLRTADGLDLAGWYVPSRNGAAVISFPTRSGKPAQARMLIRHGYGVLLLDMRGYDGSDGSPNALGWGATRDIDAAVAWLQVSRAWTGAHRRDRLLRRRRADARGRGREHGPRGGRLGRRGRALRARGAPARRPRCARRARGGRGDRRGCDPRRQRPAAVARGAVARIAPRPVFLIYAGHGAGGEELNADYYRAAGEPKAIWKIPEAGHDGGLAARPAEYERRVIAFFDDALLAHKGQA